MRLRCEKGVAMIEMAIVTPILFLLLFGIIESSLFLYNQAQITNAAREGARTASIFDVDPDGNVIDFCQANNTKVVSAINTFANDNLISFGDNFLGALDIQKVPSDGITTCRVRVNFTYDFLVLPNILTAFLGGSPSGTLDLQGEATMPLEYQG